MIKTHEFRGGFFVTPYFFNLLTFFFVNEGLIFFALK
tara:strand:+ start:128 stop:238 length:111 start_codon:yes stop_codon:yes gene_type:complete